MADYFSTTTATNGFPLLFVIEAIVVFASLVIFGRILKFVESKVSEEKKCSLFHIVVSGVSKTLIPFLCMLFLYTRWEALDISARVKSFGLIIIMVIMVFFIIRLIVTLLKKFIEVKAVQSTSGILRPSTVGFMVTFVRLGLWIIGIIFILENAGFSISAIVTGLGIGGLAIALASQNILGDLFNYIIIMFDKPYEVGDFVVVGEHSGTVEHVGMRTTRIRSLSGEQVVVSNTNLTGNRISNFKTMEQRRVAFMIDVPFEISTEKLKAIPVKIKEIIENMHGDAIFERSHVREISQYSFRIETVFFVIGPDFIKYMDVQQQINLDIKDFFDKNDIQFAYPTRRTITDSLPTA